MKVIDVGVWDQDSITGRRQVPLTEPQKAAIALILEQGPAGPSERESINEARERIEREYAKVELSSGSVGGCFGSILCSELHHGGTESRGIHFSALAEKWGVSISFLGDVIADHCRRLGTDKSPKDGPSERTLQEELIEFNVASRMRELAEKLLKNEQREEAAEILFCIEPIERHLSQGEQT